MADQHTSRHTGSKRKPLPHFPEAPVQLVEALHFTSRESALAKVFLPPVLLQCAPLSLEVSTPCASTDLYQHGLFSSAQCVCGPECKITQI